MPKNSSSSASTQGRQPTPNEKKISAESAPAAPGTHANGNSQSSGDQSRPRCAWFLQVAAPLATMTLMVEGPGLDFVGTDYPGNEGVLSEGVLSEGRWERTVRALSATVLAILTAMYRHQARYE